MLKLFSALIRHLRIIHTYSFVTDCKWAWPAAGTTKSAKSKENSDLELICIVRKFNLNWCLNLPYNTRSASSTLRLKKSFCVRLYTCTQMSRKFIPSPIGNLSCNDKIADFHFVLYCIRQCTQSYVYTHTLVQSMEPNRWDRMLTVGLGSICVCFVFFLN